MKYINSAKNTQRFAPLACAFSVALALSACGGSGDNGANNGNGSSVANTDANSSDLIIGGVTGGDATSLSDSEILRKASGRSDAGLGTSLGSLRSLSQSDESTALLSSEDGENSQAVDALDESSTNFLKNSLGVGDIGAMQNGANVTREGNIVTVKPDATELCADEIPLAVELNDNSATCVELVNDLTVQVNALSTETGILTYLFAGEPVMLVGYSPQGASYEVKLAGIFDVLERAATLNNEPFDASARLSGAFRLAASITNFQPGSEAGTLSLQVSEPIASELNDKGEQFSLQQSKVFEISFDQTTGESSIAIDWGALQVASSEEDELGNSELTDFQLGGLSATINSNDNEAGFVLSNLGIGNGLTITIGDAEAARVNLEKFGLSTVDGDVVTLSGAANANIVLNNMSGWLDEYATNYIYEASFSASDGTVVSEKEIDGSFGGVYSIESGQVSSSIRASGDNATGVSQNEESTVSVMAGECVASNRSDVDQQPLVNANCQ